MRIVFVLPSLNVMSGGVKASCQQVEMLVHAGLDAAVSIEDGAAAHWFTTRAPMLAREAIAPDDVLVFAENSTTDLQRCADAPNPKVVSCQNAHYVWQGLNGRRSYADFGVRHIVAPAHSVLHFLRRRMPGIALYHTPFFIDHELFACPQQKELRIAYMPRKRPWEVPSIRDAVVGCHPELAHIPWRPIENLPEAEVAPLLGGSAVFLSLARQEAHSMTVLEAMACGCLVAGYCGSPGGSDSSTASNGLWALEDDAFGCAEQLARALQLVSERGQQYQAMVRAARVTAAQYTRERVAPVVVEAWRQILAAI